MNDFVELRQTIAIVRRWWWLVVLGAVAGAAIGYGVSRTRPPVYEAYTTLIVGQSIQSTQLDTRDIQASERLAQTYASIAQRQAVLQKVVETLNLSSSWRNLQSRVQAKLLEGTQLLEIRVTAGEADEARDSTDEIARQLILLSPTADLQNPASDENQVFVRQQLENLRAKIAAAQARIEVLEKAMAGPALLLAQRRQELESEIGDLERSIADWQSNYAQLLLINSDKTSVNYLTILESAQVTRVSTRSLLNSLVAGVAGLALALGFIFLRERLKDTLRSADDLTRSLGLAYLGSVSRLKGQDIQHKLITSHEPLSPASEAYRIIRSKIQFVSGDQPPRSIMITSSTPGEGKSITAANLGVVMAQAGIKTILVDSDMRRPTLHRIFDVPNLGGWPTFSARPSLRSTATSDRPGWRTCECSPVAYYRIIPRSC